MINKFIYFIMLSLLMLPLASFGQHVGIGGMATDIMQPVSVIGEFLISACLVIGGAFIFASLVKYFEYRRSPLMVSLGTVFFLFLAGLALLALPVLTYLLGWKF